MEEPSARSSRLTLAGAVAATILVGGAGFLLGRTTTERTQIVVAPPRAAPAPKTAPESPTLAGVLGRSDLIGLAAEAADALAAGRAPGAALREADGRRFELRLPFGCNGPAGEGRNAAMQWRYDADAQALRIGVDPVAWTGAAWWGGDSPAGAEAIEGFWIARPWTSSEACPAGGDGPAAAGAEPVTLPGQTVALGEMFSEGGRDRRGDRPYETVVRVAEEELDSSRGFRLRLSGRIASLPGAGPVRCRQPAGAEQRPICLINVVMDEVAIENPATRETLATWSVARRETPQG